MLETGAGPVIEELRIEQARLEGRLEAMEAQLADRVATEDQLRAELEGAKAQAAAAEMALAHFQHQTEARATAARHRLMELEERLEESRAAQRQAEEERAVVIAALGRRARRRMEAAEV